MSGIVSIEQSIDPSDDEQHESADPFGRAADALSPHPSDQPPRARLSRSTALTIAAALLGVTAVIACDWWLVTLAAAGVARGDAWLRIHTDVSLGGIALTTLTLVVGGLTVAGTLDPRWRRPAN